MDDDSDIVLVERTIEALPQETFAAWTTPDLMRQWFHMGTDWSTPNVASDPRPGGRYLIEMRTPSGETLRYCGQYTDIAPARRLEMVWPAYGRSDIPTRVRVRFGPLSRGRTRVLVMHTGLPDKAARADHRVGWERVLEMLDTYFSAAGSRYEPGDR